MKNRFGVVFAVLLGVFVVGAAVPCRWFLSANEESVTQKELREFRDKQGRVFSAAVVTIDDDQVLLEDGRGRQKAFPIHAFSNDDQKFLAEARDQIAQKARKAPVTRATKSNATRNSSARSNATKGGTAQDQGGSDLAALEAERGEWSRWRGPNGDGISKETGLLKEWPQDGPPLAWRTKGLGKGFASVAVVGDRVYTLGQADGGNQLFCLSKNDGSKIWTAAFGAKEPNSTPTVDGDRIYALSRDGVLACVSMDGQVMWEVSFIKEYGGNEPTWGYSESPLVDGDLLIASPGSREAFVVAFNKNTGKPVWRTSLPPDVKLRGHGGAGYASPVISHAARTKQYVTLTGNGVIGVDAKSGRLLWGYDKIANGTANIPTPLIRGDYVFCSSGYGDGGSALLKIERSGDEFRASEVYYFAANQMQNHHGGMVLLGDYVYMGHGHNNGFPLCVHLRDGKDAWRPGRGAGRESAAMAYADGHLYFRYQDGTMALVEATPDEYRLKSSFKIAANNGPSWPHPVIAGGMLYLRDQDELLVYDIRQK